VALTNPLDRFIAALKNVTVPSTLPEAEEEVQNIMSAFCSSASFTPGDSVSARGPPPH
jgi:hypothetical protein